MVAQWRVVGWWQRYQQRGMDESGLPNAVQRAVLASEERIIVVRQSVKYPGREALINCLFIEFTIRPMYKLKIKNHSRQYLVKITSFL